MSQKLTDRIVKGLPPPAKGNKITFDTEVKGFGVRITAAGSRAFILNYRTRSGRERRYTIGQFPDWRTSSARAEAAELKRAVNYGKDPMAEIESARGAKTMADLVLRYEREQLPKNRAKTVSNYRVLINRNILPSMRHLKVAEITYSDVEELHRKVTQSGAPYQANRTLAVLSRMFSLSIRWGWRMDNPARGVERNPETKRHRYLSGKELTSLSEALGKLKDQQAADIIRLLLLTGARCGEVLAARWDQLDLVQGVWTKPGSTTKQKSIHRVPLSAPARQLLCEVRDAAISRVEKNEVEISEYVFPGRGSAHRIEIKYAWRKACIAAGIVNTEMVNNEPGETHAKVTPSARVHDLRHTYAAVLASAGLSLPIIGALLGHSQPSTTSRYAHLMDDPLRQATERVGAIIAPTEGTLNVIPVKRGV